MEDNDDEKMNSQGHATDDNVADNPSVKADEPDEAYLQPDTVHVSHFRNVEEHSVFIRYGVPFFMLCALVLLINADVGSGKLWENESYPLAILIVITSISWPFVKLFLGFYVWFMPYRRPRGREFTLEVLDALGKWSFVDIVVLVEIMVAFRSTIMLAPTVTLEIVIVPKWGFYGFVMATMMSLVSTHYILHRHRKVHYNFKSSPSVAIEGEEKVGLKAQGGLSNSFLAIAGGAIVVSLAFYTVGIVVDIYSVSNTRGDVSFDVDYSIVSVGKAMPDSQLEPNELGTRFIQAMWFFLCVAMPLWCSFLFGVLFLYPSLSKIWVERIFFMAEIAFAWSCAEVLLISTIFAVLQMPTFGQGLIQADCSACFVVDTELLPHFAFLCVGSIFSVAVNVWLYRKAHHVIYGL